MTQQLYFFYWIYHSLTRNWEVSRAVAAVPLNTMSSFLISYVFAAVKVAPAAAGDVGEVAGAEAGAVVGDAVLGRRTVVGERVDALAAVVDVVARAHVHGLQAVRAEEVAAATRIEVGVVAVRTALAVTVRPHHSYLQVEYNKRSLGCWNVHGSSTFNRSSFLWFSVIVESVHLFFEENFYALSRLGFFLLG